MISSCVSLSAPSEETLEDTPPPPGGVGVCGRWEWAIYAHIITQTDTYLLKIFIRSCIPTGEIHHEESQVFCIVYQIFMKVFFLSFLDEVFFNILDIDIVLLVDGHLE